MHENYSYNPYLNDSLFVLSFQLLSTIIALLFKVGAFTVACVLNLQIMRTAYFNSSTKYCFPCTLLSSLKSPFFSLNMSLSRKIRIWWYTEMKAQHCLNNVCLLDLFGKLNLIIYYVKKNLKRQNWILIY